MAFELIVQIRMRVDVKDGEGFRRSAHRAHDRKGDRVVAAKNDRPGTGGE